MLCCVVLCCVMLLIWSIFQHYLLAGERPAIIAPPESEWYHGRLDRYSAETRLRGSGKLGSYLGESIEQDISNISI